MPQLLSTANNEIKTKMLAFEIYEILLDDK